MQDTPGAEPPESPQWWLRPALQHDFSIKASKVDRIHAGTATDNFVVTALDGVRWFVKVYRTGSEAAAGLAAIELTEFAAHGGTPVAGVLRTKLGDLIARRDGRAFSVWEYVDAETAESGLKGRRWSTVGSAVVVCTIT